MSAPLNASATGVAAIGAQPQVEGFGLVGVRVYPADDTQQVRAAWRRLPASVAVVILTPAAADALGAERTAPSAPLTVVLPP
jgi:vacuolar-type H+-ATPase subunit F/Vma7